MPLDQVWADNQEGLACHAMNPTLGAMRAFKKTCESSPSEEGFHFDMHGLPSFLGGAGSFLQWKVISAHCEERDAVLARRNISHAVHPARQNMLH